MDIRRVITKNKLWRAYTKARLNFSTITGWCYPGIPRLKGNFLWGRLGRMFSDNGILENIVEAGKLAEQHSSGMCYFWIGNKVALLVTSVDDIYELKVKCDPNLSRNLPLLEKLAGPSLFTDEREAWRKKRHICQQALNPKSLEKLAPQMQRIVDCYINAIKINAKQPVALRTLFYNWIIDMVTMNLMGCRYKITMLEPKQIKINELTDLAQFSTSTVHDILEFRSVFKWMLPGLIRKLFFHHELNDFERLKKDIKNNYYEIFLNPNKPGILEIENIIKEIWELNHANLGHKGDLNNDEIFGDGLFLLLAGVATTVATLEFIIKLLTANPDCKEKLQAEINSYVSGGQLTPAIVEQMPYLDMVIKETMRLYPPVPLFLPREITRYTEINGVPLFKGDIPIVAAYVTHRSPKLWHEPESFIPERFAEENEDKIPKNAYMPFSIGPRFCLGQQFAMLEMKLTIAALYSNFDFSIIDNSFELSLRQGGLAPKVAPVAYFTTLC